MEVLQGKQNLGCVEFSLPKRELLPLDVQHKITSADILHDKVDTGFGLKTRMQSK